MPREGRQVRGDRPRIAVVGAGPGGLAAASALARLDGTVEVFEQADAFARVGAGINVSPNACSALAGLDVLERMRATACRPHGWTSRNWDDGDVLAFLPLGPEAEAAYRGPFLQMHRADFHQVLADLAADTREVALTTAGGWWGSGTTTSRRWVRDPAAPAPPTPSAVQPRTTRGNHPRKPPGQPRPRAAAPSAACVACGRGTVHPRMIRFPDARRIHGQVRDDRGLQDRQDQRTAGGTAAAP